MDAQLYQKLLEGGAFSLPYLITVGDGTSELNFINDTVSLTWQGKTFAASNFTFSPGTGGDSTLEIEVVDNTLISLIDGITGAEGARLKATVRGVLLEDGTVQPIRSWHAQYGNAEWGQGKMTLTFTGDERLKLTFPPLVFNTYNNRGNS